MKALFAILLFAAAACAADANVTGRWTGNAVITMPDGQTIERTALFILTQSGAAVTGTAGPDESQQLPLQDGKLEGSRLTFRVVTEDVLFNFTLTADQDRMQGEVNGTQAGMALKIKLDLSRPSVTGKWSGSASYATGDGQTRESSAFLELKQEATALSGRAGSDEGRAEPIQKGKIEGSKITFELMAGETPIVFNLVLEGDRIKGEATASRGGLELKGKVDLARVK
jgi:hypothetical protein